MDPMDIKTIIKEQYEQCSAPIKFNNLDEMDHFLERHNQPKLTKEERDNLNTHISIK